MLGGICKVCRHIYFRLTKNEFLFWVQTLASPPSCRSKGKAMQFWGNCLEGWRKVWFHELGSCGHDMEKNNWRAQSWGQDIFNKRQYEMNISNYIGPVLYILSICMLLMLAYRYIPSPKTLCFLQASTTPTTPWSYYPFCSVFFTSLV